MTEHLGHDKHSPAGNEAGNVRNGTRPKTALTENTGEAVHHRWTTGCHQAERVDP
jgi:hypothetical protein